MIEYKTNTSNGEEVYNHLAICDEYFVPALSTRTDLRTYADKLFTFAVLFEAWEDNNLVGLIGAYFNDPSGKKGFISNVSVFKKYMGAGIAREILKNCLEYGSSKGFSQVELEVGVENEHAIRFYEKAGFKKLSRDDHNIIMRIDI